MDKRKKDRLKRLGESKLSRPEGKVVHPHLRKRFKVKDLGVAPMVSAEEFWNGKTDSK